LSLKRWNEWENFVKESRMVRRMRVREGSVYVKEKVKKTEDDGRASEAK
jgi:hypothetical protein